VWGAAFVLVEQAFILSILGRAWMGRGSVKDMTRAGRRDHRPGRAPCRPVRGRHPRRGPGHGRPARDPVQESARRPDINYYLSAKPPVFLAAAAIGGVIVLAAAALLCVLFVRWFLALTITVFEGGGARRALAESAARVRGHRAGSPLLIVLWDGAILLVTTLVYAAVRQVALLSLDLAEGSTTRALGILVSLLALQSLGAALSSFLTAVGHALIVLHIYREVTPSRSQASGAAASLAHAAGAAGQRAEEVPVLVPWLHRPGALVIGLVLLVAAFVVPAIVLVSRLGNQEKIEITAHRGASIAAPENTLSAVQRAIDERAEWAEIDVQETADGHVIVVHDQDLMRLAGILAGSRTSPSSRAARSTWGPGSTRSSRASGSRTLEEVLDLARGKIRLNVELKYYGKGDPRLAPDVARILRDARCDRDCFVASLNYESLAEAKRVWPSLRTAAIVTARVGDPTRLDVDILSMNAKQVNPRFLRAARRRGKEVMVWTVDDPALARRMMDIGVDNLITNLPSVMVKLRDERSALSRVERLVLAFRVLLGGRTTSRWWPRSRRSRALFAAGPPARSGRVRAHRGPRAPPRRRQSPDIEKCAVTGLWSLIRSQRGPRTTRLPARRGSQERLTKIPSQWYGVARLALHRSVCASGRPGFAACQQLTRSNLLREAVQDILFAPRDRPPLRRGPVARSRR
jgi:glycerophosphoryl diester phosphodiesterase